MGSAGDSGENCVAILPKLGKRKELGGAQCPHLPSEEEIPH